METDTGIATGDAADTGTIVDDADESIVIDGGDNNAAIQDRMAGDDTPWFSHSTGKVVTPNGDIVLDDHDRPFTSMDAFNRWQATKTADSAKTEKKSVAQQPQQKPMSTSFDSYVSDNGNLTPEKIQELSNAGSDYVYKDELIPSLDPTIASAPVQPPVDPVERVKAERANIEAVAIKPLQEIHASLLAQGFDAATVDQFLAPIMQRQQSLVEAHYQSSYERALEERMEGKYGSKLSKIDEDKMMAASEANMEKLAQKYYPKGGKDALFSLISGHEETNANGKKTFVRGPSSRVLDLITSVALDGKKFRSEQERTAAYANIFRKMTADPAKAQALIDLAHNYWLGKKSAEISRLAYGKGKLSAQQQQQRAQKTIKTKPATYTPDASGDEDTKSMPSMLKTALGIR
jgi:hypothetical protein